MIRSLAICVALILPQGATACACCAETGEWFEHRMALEGSVLAHLAQLEAKGPAYFFWRACGMDCVKGVVDPQDSYDVTLEVVKEQVSFDLGDAGQVIFDLPEEYTHYGADPDPVSEGMPVILRTELRFAGSVIGSGDFMTDAPVPAQLVLSGLANMCFDADGLKNWRLSVTGSDTEYRLFGGLNAQ